ncbi:MAG: nitroreductase [Pseudomonadota bacterium]
MLDSTALNNTSGDLIDLLLSRRSTLAREITEPGPDRAELETILTAAARVPDHGKLAPWRFLVFEGDAQAALGDAIATALGQEDETKTPVMLKRLREFPTHAPTFVVVASTPVPESRIPVWEQVLSAGAACQNLLNAAASLGFAAQWLTGPAAYSAGVHEYLELGEDDRIAGFFFIGSPAEKALMERSRPELDRVVCWR